MARLDRDAVTRGFRRAWAAGARHARRLVIAAGVMVSPLAAQDAPTTLPAGTGYAHPHSNAKAPLQVIEFSDFGCGYCATFALEMFASLEQEFVATGRVRWTFVPFRMVGFTNADEAAEASECAGEQQKFWPMHDRLFADQKLWSRAADPARLFNGYAEALKLDLARFGKCTQSRKTRARILDQTSLAREMGARSTPTFFVNGRRIEGALPPAQFRLIVLRELAKVESASSTGSARR